MRPPGRPPVGRHGGSGCCGPRHHLMKADATQNSAVPRNGPLGPARPRPQSRAAGRFHKPGDSDITTQADWGHFSRESAWFSAPPPAEEAGFWHESRRAQVLSKARTATLFSQPGLRPRLQTQGGENRVQAGRGCCWCCLTAMGPGLRTHSGINKGFLGPSPQVPGRNRRLFVSWDVPRALGLRGGSLGPRTASGSPALSLGVRNSVTTV